MLREPRADYHFGIAHIVFAADELREKALPRKEGRADHRKPPKPAVRVPRKNEIAVPVLILQFLL